MSICQKKILWLSLAKLRAPRAAPKFIFWKFIWLSGWSWKGGFSVYSIKQQAKRSLSTINGTAKRMDLNHVVIFNLPKNFHPNESCIKCFEGEIGCGWRQHPRYSTTNSVFMTEFDSFFSGLRFYVGWTCIFSSRRNF